jgi:hypothetical protein
MTQRHYITVSITLEVWNEERFRVAAAEQSKVDGESDEEANRFLDADQVTLNDCALMLFDKPSPNGCSVVSSETESFDREPR